MTVPKEIAIKANRYEMLKKEVDELYEELESWASENGFDGIWVNDFGTAQEPVGEEQEDGEYCNQTMTGKEGSRRKGWKQVPSSGFLRTR